MLRDSAGIASPVARDLREKELGFTEVRVLRQEAVGMYEIAVLEAGSAAALGRWLDDHGYVYPDGMDAACNDYVRDGWCFVAVKTKVGQKRGVDPKPGMRDVNSKLPEGASFDGNVQAMGFRFRTDEFVVPMRLSAFNEGELRNVMYILSDQPLRVNSISSKYVVRQIAGEQLYRNVTDPLPLRIIGGKFADIPDWRRKNLDNERNPVPYNGLARDLFASDVLAALSGQLSHPHEEEEKELLRIGERLGMRGPAIDALHHDALAEAQRRLTTETLAGIKNMTLTVIDGDFPREVLAKQNLTFDRFAMKAGSNTPERYDARRLGPGPKKEGTLHLGMNRRGATTGVALAGSAAKGLPRGLFVLALAGAVAGAFVVRARSRRNRSSAGRGGFCVLLVVSLFAPASSASQQSTDRTVLDLINRLDDATRAQPAVGALVALGQESVPELGAAAESDPSLVRRGWAVVCLAEIGGRQARSALKRLNEDAAQPHLVRTWAAAGLIHQASTAAELFQLAALGRSHPAVVRPIGMTILGLMGGSSAPASLEDLMRLIVTLPVLEAKLAPTIMGFAVGDLIDVMTRSSDQNSRRKAAGFLAAMAMQGDTSVGGVVVEAYAFSVKSNDVPWSGGPLFVPSIQWSKDQARALVGELISWHLWCERTGRPNVQKQIHNNIRSIQLARIAGYTTPGWQEVGIDEWLLVWGRLVGRAEIKRMLAEQGVADEPRYKKILAKLG